METLKIEVRTVGKLSFDIAETIRRRNDREFGNDSLVYDAPEWYILGYLKGKLTSYVGILHRTITIEGNPIKIAGICYLVTEPEERGHGFASAVMREAVNFVKDELRLPFGLLTCKSKLEPLYAANGWHTVAGPTVFDQADGIRNCGGLTMINECGGVPWPEGKINLCGLPW